MTDVEAQVILAQEIIIPFQVNGVMTNFKLICPKCASTFWIMADDNQSIGCEKEKCDAVPLVVPKGFEHGKGMWKI